MVVEFNVCSLHLLGRFLLCSVGTGGCFEEALFSTLLSYGMDPLEAPYSVPTCKLRAISRSLPLLVVCWSMILLIAL